MCRKTAGNFLLEEAQRQNAISVVGCDVPDLIDPRQRQVAIIPTAKGVTISRGVGRSVHSIKLRRIGRQQERRGSGQQR